MQRIKKSNKKQEVKEEIKGSPPALNSILTQVQSGLSFRHRFYSVESHIDVLKRTESKEVKERPKATQAINAYFYMQWFLADSSLFLSFLAATEPLRKSFNADKKVCQFSGPVYATMDEFFNCYDRAMAGRVCKDFKFFPDRNRKKHGIPPNYTVAPAALKCSQDPNYHFFYMGKDSILRGVNYTGRNGFRMQVMRDGRIAEMCATNEIIIYDNAELDAKGSEILLFSDPNDVMGQVINSIDILLDGRYVVGKLNGTIEIYNKDLKLESLPESVAEKLKTCVSCATEVAVLSNGVIISNHKQLWRNMLDVFDVPCFMATDLQVGKMYEIECLSNINASNVVGLPYEHFAVIADTDDFELEMVILSCHNYKIKSRHKVDLDPESDELPGDGEYPKLCVGNGQIIAYANGVMSLVQFPLCTAEKDPPAIPVTLPRMKLGGF